MTFATDGAEVYEHILTLIPGDEAEAFTGVEPFDRARFAWAGLEAAAAGRAGQHAGQGQHGKQANAGHADAYGQGQQWTGHRADQQHCQGRQGAYQQQQRGKHGQGAAYAGAAAEVIAELLNIDQPQQQGGDGRQINGTVLGEKGSAEIQAAQQGCQANN